MEIHLNKKYLSTSHYCPLDGLHLIENASNIVIQTKEK